LLDKKREREEEDRKRQERIYRLELKLLSRDRRRKTMKKS
jgi:hypothetical protein